MMSIYIRTVATVAPGLTDWSAAAAVLTGAVPYQTAPIAKYKTTLLPSNETRRMTETTRLAFAVLEGCLADISHRDLPSVFASYSSDVVNLDALCTQLARDPAMISPTKFHNSVANAPAGYWSIATGSRAPSTAIAAGSATFVVGLLEAAMIANAERTDVVYACYDIASPATLATHRPIANAFASGWLLSPTITSDSIGKVTFNTDGGSESTLTPGPLEDLRRSNPSARALPLLRAVALGNATTLQYFGQHAADSTTGWTLNYEPTFR